MTQRIELESSDDNVCFGCGLENPMGLKLRFYREGDQVLTECSPNKWWSGQPGVVNPGITYAVLIDLVIWTAGAILSRVPLLPKTVDMKLGDLSTKRPFSGNARIVKRDGPTAQIRAEISQDGVTKAWLEMETKAVTRDEFTKARPFVEIPDSLQGYFEGEKIPAT